MNTETDTQLTTPLPESTGTEEKTDIPASTEKVEETLTSGDSVKTSSEDIAKEQEDQDIKEEEEEEDTQEDVDEQDSDIVYIVRVNDIIRGFSYTKKTALSYFEETISVLCMRDTSSYRTYTVYVEDGIARIYGTYRFMGLITYDRILYEITCEEVEHL